MSAVRPCMKLKLTKNKPDIFSSKIGGLGYLPHDMDIPVNKNGNQLRLLAQINCSDVKLENFPKTGLLQFWILNDTFLGLDFEDGTNQDGFRVIYHPYIDTTVSELEVSFKVFKSPFDDDDNFPIRGEYAVSMVACEENSDDSDEDHEAMQGHKIGGFPYFIQSDPRKTGEVYDFLLFQIDSDYATEKDESGRLVYVEKIRVLLLFMHHKINVYDANSG